MLKQRAKEKAARHGCNPALLEAYCSRFLSALLGTPVVSVCGDAPKMLSRAGEWFCFMDQAGGAFGVCFQRTAAARRSAAYFRTLLSMAERLKGLRQGPMPDLPFLGEDLPQSGDWLEQPMALFSGEAPFMHLGMFRFGFTTPCDLRSPCGAEAERAQAQRQMLLMRRIRARGSLHLTAPDLALRSELQLPYAESGWRLVFEWRGVKRVFKLSAAGGAPGMELRIEGESMEEGKDVAGKVECSLCLGSLEMTLDEALSLRPGMKVEFDRPELLEGVIQIAGGDWARVRIALNESAVCLEVRELVS
jgi:hypothetical protein